MTKEVRDILYNTLDTVLQTNAVATEIEESDIIDTNSYIELEVEKKIQLIMEGLDL